MIDRLALIGDVHAEDGMLERALQYASKNADLALCVGDIVDGPGNVSRCCALLIQHQVPTVRGNHERWLFGGPRRLPKETRLDDLSIHAKVFLASLPTVLEFATHKGRLLLCHGLDQNDMAGVRPGDEGYALENNTDLWKLVAEDRYQLVANGHTHRRLVRRFGGLTVVNAGTLAREHQPGFSIVHTREGIVRHFDFDERHEFHAAGETELPETDARA